MKIYVDSPHQLIRESLHGVIERRHEVVTEAEAEIAIKDLCSCTFPYPKPPPLPTLALICGDTLEDAGLEVLQAGYRGYLNPTDGEVLMEKALQVLLRGENWAERHVLAQLLEQHNTPRFSEREGEVYGLILQGLSNKEIAAQLKLSVNTVKVYVSKLFQKLQVKTRSELLVKTTQLG